MIYNFHEIEKTNKFHEWTLVELCTLAYGTVPAGFDPSSIEINLTVNGKPVDILTYTERMFDQIEHFTSDKAKNLVEDLDSEIIILLRRIKQRLTENLESKGE